MLPGFGLPTCCLVAHVVCLSFPSSSEMGKECVLVQPTATAAWPHEQAQPNTVWQLLSRSRLCGEQKKDPLWFSPPCLPYELQLPAIKLPRCLKGGVRSNSLASHPRLNAEGRRRSEGCLLQETSFQPSSSRAGQHMSIPHLLS